MGRGAEGGEGLLVTSPLFAILEIIMAEKKISLTGDRPTGKLHLGHYVGSLLSRMKLQDEYKQFVMIADVQALTDNADNPQKVRDNLLEVLIDNIAAGVDPAKTTFFIQSMVPAIAELTVFFLNLVTVSRLERNPTVKDEMKQKGFGKSVPAGFLAYPVSQAGDILFCRADVVPVGADQLPMIEQTNEIVDKFNSLYGPVFKHAKAIVSQAARLRGTDGQAKMGKSLGNVINLSDDDETITSQVMKMYTDPGHIHTEDPGKVEGNVVFEYLDVFDTNKDELANLKMKYQKGGLGDVEIKKRLSKVLIELLTPIRERREKLEKDRDALLEILKKGTDEARQAGEDTMALVRRAMKIDYF